MPLVLMELVSWSKGEELYFVTNDAAVISKHIESVSHNGALHAIRKFNRFVVV